MTTPEASSLANVASELSGGSVTVDSPGLLRQLEAALSWARQYCGWHVWPQRAELLTVDGPGSPLLQLPTLNIVSVASVQEIPDWCAANADAEHVQLVERRDFSWSAAGMLRKRIGCWTREFRGIDASLVHGYDDAGAADFLAVVVKAATRAGNTSDGEITRVGEISYQASGAGSVGGSVFLQSEYHVLDLYRLNAEA